MRERRLAVEMPPAWPKADARIAPSARWAAWVRRQWGRVRVTHVETTPIPDGAPDHVRVRANVHLGSLVPADVLVDATADGAKVSGEWSTRLASSQSYGNGTYVFEGLLSPHGDADRSPLIVRVRPGTAHDAFSALGKVVRAFEICPASGRAANKARRTRREPVRTG